MPHADVEDRKAYQREYSREYRQRCRDSVRTTQQTQWNKARIAALATLGGSCSECGNADPRVLDIDHINGDGHLDRKRRSKFGILRAVIRGESGYQLLCANCHRIKTSECKEYLVR